MTVPNEASLTVQDGDDYAETLRRERLSIAEQLAVLVVRAHRRTAATAQPTSGCDGSTSDKAASGI